MGEKTKKKKKKKNTYLIDFCIFTGIFTKGEKMKIFELLKPMTRIKLIVQR